MVTVRWQARARQSRTTSQGKSYSHNISTSNAQHRRNYPRENKLLHRRDLESSERQRKIHLSTTNKKLRQRRPVMQGTLQALRAQPQHLVQHSDILLPNLPRGPVLSSVALKTRRRRKRRIRLRGSESLSILRLRRSK
jgi:hypothetical protein